MVLYKRKAIVLPDPKTLPIDLNVQVWHIDETGEWFLTYEEYLERLEFYTRHHFTCEITGTSCLTFFEALDSEETQFKYVEERFPLKLREPVARFLHFNPIKRLDNLVEKVYARFKNDFYPGEIVFLRKTNKDVPPTNSSSSATLSQVSSPQPADSSIAQDGSDMLQGHFQRPYVVKEKAQFNATMDPSTGKMVPAYCKYMLSEEGQSDKSFIADQSQIYRDRSTFTKHLIKCFCKITLCRASSKMGAPWCVKEEYLPIYGLTMDWPLDMVKFKDDEPELIIQQSSSSSKAKRSNNNRPSNKIDSSDDIVDDIEIIEVDMPDSNSTDNHKRQRDYELTINANRSQSSKKKKTSNTNNVSSAHTNNSEKENVPPVPESIPTVITSIVDDLVLPHKESPKIFENFYRYNMLLERIKVNGNPFNPLPNFGRLLQIFQFLNTFGSKLYLTHFNLDQFVASLKCTDPNEIKGEVVYVKRANSVKKEETNQETEKSENEDNKLDKQTGDSDSEIDEDESELNGTSNWKRNPKVRKLVKDRCNDVLTYSIILDEEASDDVLDNVNNNGTALLLEIFASLLRLFIDENGNWTCLVVEEWFEEEVLTKSEVDDKSIAKKEEEENNVSIKTKEEDKLSNNTESNDTEMKTEENKDSDIKDTNIKTELDKENSNNVKNEEKSVSEQKSELQEIKILDDDENETDESDKEEEIDPILERCLNYRNVNWAERLAKRQFNNSYWLLILLGILQDSMHVPTYKNIVENFTKKVIPEEISASQLPKQMWKNYCRNLTLSEKVDTLWVLVDLLLNFSPSIKSEIEKSMDLCSHIRSERFRISRGLKNEQSKIHQNQIILNQLEKQEVKDTSAIDEMKKTQDELENIYENLKKDKQLLDEKLMENDLQRLKSLGIDRFGNRYYWLELCGVPVQDLLDDESKTEYHSGRIWVQGPSEEAAMFFLNIDKQEIEKWKSIALESGSIKATQEVFNVVRKENKSYVFIINGEETYLADENGIANPTLELSPIQKKILDETPQGLLLSSTQWHCIEDIQDVKKLLEWFDTWGRREHDLIRQFGNIKENIEACYTTRNNRLCLFEQNAEEKKLLERLDANELTENELELLKEEELRDEESDSESQVDEEDELEKIADEILKLDDSSKTRKVLNKIQELEDRRDTLLQKIQQKEISERPGARVQARAEKRRLKTLCENKMNEQASILTDLLNLRHYSMMEDVIDWKNKVAKKIWGTALRKNTSNNKKTAVQQTVEEKLQAILEQTSRIDVTAQATE